MPAEWRVTPPAQRSRGGGERMCRCRVPEGIYKIRALVLAEAASAAAWCVGLWGCSQRSFVPPMSPCPRPLPRQRELPPAVCS